jgi:NAD(P)-dependent dehydrogenase (short-subunit alcohol dehydrogenase family)
MDQKMKEFTLNDKVALVTGAIGLIGREVTDALGSAGCDLILLDILPQEEIDIYAKLLSKKHTITVKGFRANIIDVDTISIILDQAVELFGKIDILINLAAIDAKFDKNIEKGNNTSFENYPLALWEKTVNVNMTGTFNITQQVIRKMLEQGGGNIINVASTYSLVSPNQNLYNFEGEEEQLFKPIDYVATKSMIPNFTRYLATFYGRKGIRVNTIVPHGVVSNASEDFENNFSKLSPLGRTCLKEELRGPFIFLASDASSYMTGSTLVVDGGWTAW